MKKDILEKKKRKEVKMMKMSYWIKDEKSMYIKDEYSKEKEKKIKKRRQKL